MMRTDIRETESEYVLEAELPGFKSEEIRVTVRDNVLTVSAERSDLSEESDESGDYLRRERAVGRIRRSFDVSGARTDGISAAFRDGILFVTIPKPTTPAHVEREIRIEGSDDQRMP